MFTDLILFLAATVTVVKLAMKNVIPADLAGPMLGAVVIGIAVLRIFGSTAFRRRIRLPKVLGSLAILALDLAQGDPMSAMLVGFCIAGIAVMMFGLYYMPSAIFPDSVNRKGSRTLALGTVVAFLICAFAIAALLSHPAAGPVR